jgi:hypothetical protein
MFAMPLALLAADGAAEFQDGTFFWQVLLLVVLFWIVVLLCVVAAAGGLIGVIIGAVISMAMMGIMIVATLAALGGVLGLVPGGIAWSRRHRRRWWVTFLGFPSVLLPPLWFAMVAWALFGTKSSKPLR